MRRSKGPDGSNPVEWRKELLKGYLDEYPVRIALRRFLPAAVISKLSFFLPDTNRLYRYPGGYIYLNLSESHMMIHRWFGTYEYWKRLLFLDILKPGMTVADVGVCRGYFSLIMAKAMKDRGRVLSFEPDPDNCHWFKKSVEANGYGSIELIQVALSDEKGTTTFYPGMESGWGRLEYFADRTLGESASREVQMERLDDHLEKRGIEQLDVMKIDVQGSEMKVIRGAKRTLRRSRRMQLIMDVDTVKDDEMDELFNILHGNGFRIFNIGRDLMPVGGASELVNDEIYAVKSG